MSRVYYNQADSRWANYPYPSKELPKATIKSGGCGPTSCAMIVSSLKNIVTPVDMARLFLDNGLRANGGTSSKAFNWISNKFGIDMIETTNVDKAIDTLCSGGMCIAHCKAGGVFSTGGHYIVLAYMKNSNTICVFDPYLYKNKFNTSSRKGKVTVNGNDVYVTIDNFKKYSNCTRLFCYRPEQEDYSDQIAHVKTKIDKAPIRNSMDHNTNKNVLAHMKKGTELSVLERINEWFRCPQGYVNSADCERTQLFLAETKIDKAPIRNTAEHNTSKNVLAHMKKGTKLSIVELHRNQNGKIDEWWLAPQGYVNKNDCKKI